MKETPESAQDAIDINPKLVPELGQLSQIARAELKCKTSSPVHSDCLADGILTGTRH